MKRKNKEPDKKLNLLMIFYQNDGIRINLNKPLPYRLCKHLEGTKQKPDTKIRSNSTKNTRKKLQYFNVTYQNVSHNTCWSSTHKTIFLPFTNVRQLCGPCVDISKIEKICGWIYELYKEKFVIERNVPKKRILPAFNIF